MPAIKQGFIPDSISTDLHIGSMNAGMKDMLNVMSKFLNMGMTLDQVIAAIHMASRARDQEGRPGQLSAGAPADVAVLRLEKGNFGFVDILRRANEGHAEARMRAYRERWHGGLGSERHLARRLEQARIRATKRRAQHWDGTLNSSVRGRK